MQSPQYQFSADGSIHQDRLTDRLRETMSHFANATLIAADGDMVENFLEAPKREGTSLGVSHTYKPISGATPISGIPALSKWRLVAAIKGGASSGHVFERSRASTLSSERSDGLARLRPGGLLLRDKKTDPVMSPRRR